MVNLSDKRELLKTKEIELCEQEKLLQSFSEKAKNAKTDELSQVENDTEKIIQTIKKLKSEIKTVSDEINNEEKNLRDLSNEIEKQKAKKLGGNNMNYLQSKEALLDFAKLLQKTGGREALKEAWAEHLYEKGISNPDVFLPQMVVTSISDALDKAGSIFSTFKYTGLTMLKVAFNNNITDETARAKGHKKGTAKEEQIITAVAKEIRAQYIYKYITIDRETLRETQDTGAVIKYVLEELPQRIIREIERAAMIGDGRTSSASNKINSYESILRDAADDFVTVQTASDNDLLGDLVKMDATITASGRRYLVISRQTLATLKLSSNNGGLVFPIGSDIASLLGYAAIFTPDWMDEESAPLAIEYVGEAYKTVGDSTIDSYENFTLSQNKNEFLMEIYSGGGLDTLKSAAVLKKNAAA